MSLHDDKLCSRGRALALAGMYVYAGNHEGFASYSRPITTKITTKTQEILQGSTCKDVDSYLATQRMTKQDNRVQINTLDGTLSSYRYGR